MGLIAKDDNIFFDKLTEALDGKQASAQKVHVALQAFMNKPVMKKRKIQATGVSTDFEQLTKDAFNITVEEDNFDLGWERAYRQVPLGSGQDSWEIYNVENGITFQKVEEGQRIEVSKISGDKVTAYVDYYGGGLGWTDKMIRFRKVPAMVDLAMAFRNKYWANKATNHYSLITAAGAGNVTAYQGVADDGQAQRDIQTINEAAYVLTERLKDVYGDTANIPLVMYANPRDKSRVNAAFAATTAALLAAGRTGDIIDWNIQVIWTYFVNAGSPQLVMPLKKIQRADSMMPTTYTAPKDVLTLNEVQAVWAIYGAAIGDTDQVQQVTLG